MSIFTPMSRRTLLSAATIATAVPAVMQVSPFGAPFFPQAHAAEAADKSLSAVHRFNLGKLRVSVIDDARFTFPAPAFAVNQEPGTVEAFLQQYGLAPDFVNLHMQVTLIETGSHKVLLDTGMGDVTFPGNNADNGRLISSLWALGVEPKDITDVIISHGHPDHIGSCSKQGEPLFKNARYHIPPAELEFWTQKPEADDPFFKFMLAIGNEQLLSVKDLISPYADGDEIVPGVTAIAAPGHTIAHHAFLLHDGDQKLLHLMDSAIHYLVGTEQPDWALAVELDSDLAAATRNTLFKQAVYQQLLVAGYHFPFPGIGRLIRQNNSWRYVPVQTA